MAEIMIKSPLDNSKALEVSSSTEELHHFQRSARWSRLKEMIMIALLGGVPKPFGALIRTKLYALIIGKVGASTAIQGTGVELAGAQWITLGDGVKIQRDVCLHAFAPESKIYIDNGVYLNRGVDINVVPHLGHCQIEIGENTVVGPYTCIHGPGHIRIGNACLIASHVGIFANNHDFSDPEHLIMNQGLTCVGIEIEDDCWLGTGVKILDGVKIGKGSVIGAGAVVTKNIPPYSIAVGVPAKVISSRLNG